MGKVTWLVSRQGLEDRIQLARSLLSHRRWCPECRANARLVEQALNGESIGELSRKEGA